MVRYSKVGVYAACCVYLESMASDIQQLAFRQTVYAYGTDLCWTPMILAKEFNRNQVARDSGMYILDISLLLFCLCRPPK